MANAKLVISIDRESAATKGFDGLSEIGRILQELADRCKHKDVSNKMDLIDIDGNVVGVAKFSGRS